MGGIQKVKKYIHRATVGVDPSTKLNRNPPRPRRNTANSGLMKAHRHTATPTMRVVLFVLFWSGVMWKGFGRGRIFGKTELNFNLYYMFRLYFRTLSGTTYKTS